MSLNIYIPGFKVYLNKADMRPEEKRFKRFISKTIIGRGDLVNTSLQSERIPFKAIIKWHQLQVGAGVDEIEVEAYVPTGYRTKTNFFETIIEITFENNIRKVIPYFNSYFYGRSTPTATSNKFSIKDLLQQLWAGRAKYYASP